MKVIVVEDALKASEETILARLAVCENCDRNQNGTCAECNCLIERKTLYQDYTCPLGKW
jgi:coenzyme F420-reducing hydrogenase gamma subunit